MIADRNETIRDAWFELEHISGFFDTLQEVRDRFREVNSMEPMERVDSFRHAVEATCDDVEKMIQRINRWWRPFDHAVDKLVSALSPGEARKFDPDSRV